MQNQKNFTTFLWGAPFIGSIGRSVYDMAIIWLILDITNSEKYTGLIAMTTYLPAIFFGLFIGALVDMYSKTRVMAFATSMQAIAVLGVPLFLLFDIRLAWIIMILAIFHNSFSIPFVPAFNAYLPTQIEKDKLLKANSIVNIAWQSAVFIGPIVTAYALTIISIEYILSLIHI